MDRAYNEGNHLIDLVEFLTFIFGLLTLLFIIGFFIFIMYSGNCTKGLYRYLRENESTPGVGDNMKIDFPTLNIKNYSVPITASYSW